MAEFINTVDILGDDAVTDSIIERSITQYHDDAVTIVNISAFNSCSALTDVKLPAANVVNANAFDSCTALALVDLRGGIGIDANAFANCSVLTAVILRNTGNIAALWAATAFKNTPIASGTGYIYVPAALVDSYKAAANWKTYAAQFRALEDYTVDGTTAGELDPNKI